MTEDSVVISITIRVSEREVKIENEVGIGDMEESIQGIMLVRCAESRQSTARCVRRRLRWAKKLEREWFFW